MSSPPPKKKLRQSSIVDSFKKQLSNVSQSLTSCHKPLKDSEADGEEVELTHKAAVKVPEKEEETENMSKFDHNDPARDCLRDKMAAAAEKRRLESAVPSSSSSSSPKKSQGVNEQGASGYSSGSKNEPVVIPESPSSSVCSPTLEMDMTPPLFDSDPEFEMIEDDASIPDNVTLSREDSTSWKGVPITSLKTTPSCLPPLGPLTTHGSHTVLVKTPLVPNQIPKPSFNVYKDRWDCEHVKMPCSPENLYPVEGKDGRKDLRNRWDLIQEALKDNIVSSVDLEEAILLYNTRYSQKWDFRGLHSFFTEVLPAAETKNFFKNVLPKMVDLALQLPQICTQGIPLLKKTDLHSVTMSQQQIACLLANAFFCTFPRRNARGRQSEYSSYPDINLNQLFMGLRGDITKQRFNRKREKLKCILNYFKRVTTEMPTGTVTFRRQSLKEFPKWHLSSQEIGKLHVTCQGTIEDDGVGMLQVDFANKFLGGGVLNFGCVQEEIRFMICPEMIISRLITEVLDFNECLIMTGCERFSNYTGYSDTFRWAGDHLDPTPRDSWGRRCTEVVAIDALIIRNYTDQFAPQPLRREINKAYCGFLAPGVAPQYLSAVATGNWGCGAFGGDLRLKALLQMMAAAEAGRDVCYFTFSDTRLRDDMANIHEFICERGLCISDLWALIQQYNQNVCKSSKPRKLNLFEYIIQVYEGCNDDTDEDDGSDTSLEMRASRHKHSPSPDYAANTP